MPQATLWRGRVVLAFPMTLLALGLVALALARREVLDWRTLSGAGLFAVALLATAVWLRLRLRDADPLLLPIAAMLAALGQIMTSRLEPALGPRQGIWVLIGLGALVLVTNVNPRVLRKYKYTCATLALLLQVVTLIAGQDPNGSGARLWFIVGPLSVQPTEAVKLLLVVFLAAYLEDNRELLSMSSKRVPMAYLAPILLMVGVALALFWLQRDLGPALLFSTVLLTMLYVASGRLSYVVGGLALLVLGGAIASRLIQHVGTRIAIWLDPWSLRETVGYQLVQALYALSSGGVFGAGLDFGAPRYIPAVHTDFIIAAIGEELGLAGTLAVVALFVVFVSRGLLIALRARDGFLMLLAFGLTAVVALQALIILGGTLELIPLTGITLPFVSYGGSSVVANFLLVGTLLRISADA
jgi:cell division protein FtsW